LTINQFFNTILSIDTDRSEIFVGYKILTNRDAKWQSRVGLEGPFFYVTGQVLYYDPKEGQYWNPLTDFYMSTEEMNTLHVEIVKILAR